jgi:hypothetical protein
MEHLPSFVFSILTHITNHTHQAGSLWLFSPHFLRKLKMPCESRRNFILECIVPALGSLLADQSLSDGVAHLVDSISIHFSLPKGHILRLKVSVFRAFQRPCDLGH